MKKYVTFGIMLSLLGGKRITARTLAEKYETSIKTIYRAIDTLLEAGMPIRCTQGKNGGYELIETSKINSSFFTVKELSSFISFIKTNHENFNQTDLSIDDRLYSLCDKNLAKELVDNSKQFVIDTAMWGNNPNNKKFVDMIKQNISSKNKLLIEYVNLKTNLVDRRIIHPYTLVYKSDCWYLYSFCEQRKSFRLFKLSRIKNIEKLNQTFEWKDIDILSKPWNKDFKNNLEKIDIELVCSPLVIAEVQDWLGENSTIINTQNENALNTIIKGSALYSQGLVHKIMEFGNKVQVLSPQKLKEAVMNECKNIYNQYKEKAC